MNLLIIDGNNVLFSDNNLRNALNSQDIGDLQVELIENLKIYTKRFSNIKTIVVFDGDKGENTQNENLNFQVLFSGIKKDADKLIIQVFRESKSDYENVIVISTDKKIYCRIESYGGISITSRDFLERVESSNKESIKVQNLYIQKYPNKRETRLQLLNLL